MKMFFKLHETSYAGVLQDAIYDNKIKIKKMVDAIQCNEILKASKAVQFVWNYFLLIMNS